MRLSNMRRFRLYAVAVVRARDGDACWICEEPIDWTHAPPEHDRRASLDHVIPKALGGTDDIANLRIAHRGCNSARGSRLPMPCASCGEVAPPRRWNERTPRCYACEPKKTLATVGIDRFRARYQKAFRGA